MNGDPNHRHGGFRPADFARLGVPERAVLDFSVNLNPLGPPPLIRERWGPLFEAIRDYPSVGGEGIALYYERRYGVPPDHFLAGNGSTEMIYLIPRALGIKRALVIGPCFHDYSRASRLAGASVIHQPLLQEGRTFVLDRAEVLERMREVDALWLGNPNNPTGNLHPREAIVDLCMRFPDKWVIIDEAFIPLVDDKERFSLIGAGRPRNLLILHSLTKFYALAGIRIGGVVASRDVILRLRKFKEPWTVNGVAERIAPLLLECGEYEERTLTVIRAERNRVRAALQESKAVFALNPSANFMLCQWRLTEELNDLLKHLLSQGIYVRDCRNFPGLEKNWFRVAIMLPEQNDRLLSAISSYAPSR